MGYCVAIMRAGRQHTDCLHVSGRWRDQCTRLKRELVMSVVSAAVSGSAHGSGVSACAWVAQLPFAAVAGGLGCVSSHNHRAAVWQLG